jgi:hypothetical protein
MTTGSTPPEAGGSLPPRTTHWSATPRWCRVTYGSVIATSRPATWLSTSRQSFYARLGWERWRGPSYVRHGEQLIRTADEDAGLMVLRAGASAGPALTASITCDARRGDDW